MSPFSFPLDQAVEDKVFAELQDHGLTCLEDVVAPAFLARCRSRVEEILKENGERYFSIIQPWQTPSPAPFDEIAKYDSFLRLMKNLSRRGHSQRAADESKLLNVLRIIAGRETATRAYEFHYDATVVTVLMPLFIPEDTPGKAGDLVAFPNDRGYRRFAAINVLEKIFLQNRIAYRFYRKLYGSGSRNVVKLKPSNLYFFWGYRTFHGNLPSAPNSRRATLLFHYGDPHPGNVLTKSILAIRRIRERIRLHAR